MDTIHQIITNPAYHDYLAVLKGTRNGFVYGAKVRFPHALVMSILFGHGDWRSRLRFIYRATKQHALNLAKFVTLYKTFLLIQKKANGGKESSIDTFVAGVLGGYVVFGSRNAVNEQIVLYVASRVVAALLPRAVSPTSAPSESLPAGSLRTPIPPDSRYFAIFSALTWGSALWLFKHHSETIQPGMFNSMVYLYRDSNAWNNLRTLLWYNK